MDFEEEIDIIFKKYSINLSSSQIEKFSKYYHLLFEYNQKINLTSITEQSDVIVKHFLDSVLPYSLLPQGAKVIDIGCGAGFPSIPLKIIRPDIELVLVDSVQKKLTFINNIIDKLKLDKTKTVHSRAEDLANKIEFREKFDIVVSRAVARLNILAEYCLPFLKIGGKFVAYKSQDYNQEISEALNALKILGGVTSSTCSFDIEGNDRNIVIIDKILSTPSKYPRGKNKPRLNPL